MLFDLPLPKGYSFVEENFHQAPICLWNAFNPCFESFESLFVSRFIGNQMLFDQEGSEKARSKVPAHFLDHSFQPLLIHLPWPSKASVGLLKDDSRLGEHPCSRLSRDLMLLKECAESLEQLSYPQLGEGVAQVFICKEEGDAPLTDTGHASFLAVLGFRWPESASTLNTAALIHLLLLSNRRKYPSGKIVDDLLPLLLLFFRRAHLNDRGSMMPQV